MPGKLVNAVVAIMLVAATMFGLVAREPASTLAADPRLIDLTITDQISGGGEVRIRVELNRVASVNTVVSLRSSRPEIVDVPSTITVTAGRRTGDGVVVTPRVAQRTKVVLTATLDGKTSSETVTVLPVQLDSLSSPSSITSGQSGQATVRLTEPAPSTGVQVRITCNRPSGMSCPDTVEVAPSRQTARFTFTTNAISTNADVKITAKLAGSSNVFDTTTVKPADDGTATATATATETATATVTATATATEVVQPLITTQILTLPIPGIAPGVVQVCLTEPSAEQITFDLDVDNAELATLGVNQITLGGLVNCDTFLVTGLEAGDVTVWVSRDNLEIDSILISIPDDATATATATGTTEPEYVIDFDVIQLPILGSLPAVVNVCLTEPSAEQVTVDLGLSDSDVASLGLNQLTLGGLTQCQTVLVTGLANGTVNLTATADGVTFQSPVIDFGDAPAATPTGTVVVVDPTITFTVIVPPLLGLTPALVNVCWTDPVADVVLAADVTSTNPSVAVVDLDLNFLLGSNCHEVAVAGLLAGTTRLQVEINGVTYQSEEIDFSLL